MQNCQVPFIFRATLLTFDWLSLMTDSKEKIICAGLVFFNRPTRLDLLICYKHIMMFENVNLVYLFYIH